MSRRPAGAPAGVLAILLAGSCTTSGDPTDAGRTPPLPSPASSYVIPSPVLTPRPFTADDLAGVVLGRTDTPSGTEFAPQYSVDQTIDEFAADDEELTALRGDGFVLGHITLFVPEGQLEQDAPPVEPGQVFVQGVAALFETDVGADSSLRRYVSTLRASQLDGEVRIPAEELGESAEGLRGRSDGEPVTIYAWRSANLVLAVSGSGEIAPPDVRTLAHLIERRADRLR